MLRKICRYYKSDLSYLNKGLFSFLFFRTSRVMLAIRICQFSKGLIFTFARVYLRTLFIDIGKNIDIGVCLRLPHPHNITIAGRVCIGDNVQINQYVTIGGNFDRKCIVNDKERGFPIIGSDVVIAAGAVIGGPVVISNSVIIGANATITKDVSANTMVYGQNKTSSKKIVVLPDEGTYRLV